MKTGLRYLAFWFLTGIVLSLVIFRFTQRERTQSSQVMSNQKVKEEKTVDLASWQATQDERIKRIKKVCSERSDLNGWSLDPNQTLMLHEPTSNLLYCINPEESTKTMLLNILSIANAAKVVNVDAKSLQDFRNGLADLPAYAIENFNTNSDPRILSRETLSFTIVQHPFTRLLAAYKSTIGNPNDKYYKMLRDVIFATYGSSGFPQFLQYLVLNKLTAGDCRDYHHCRLDAHLVPHVSSCFYCQMEYKYILKRDTLQADVEGLMATTKMNMTDEVLENMAASGDGKWLADLLEKEEASERLLRQQFRGHWLMDFAGKETLMETLIRLYAADFEMFGYDPYSFCRENII